MTSVTREIFLSSVTSEFGKHREMLKHDLSLPDVKVQEEADFVQFGAQMLGTLDRYIRDKCDSVVHLVGFKGGSTIKAAEAKWLTETHPDFIDQFPHLKDDLQSDAPSVSYTQMEALLAIYHKKPCFIYVQSDLVKDPSSAEPSQRRHWDHLVQLSQHYTPFDDKQHLCRLALRDLHDRFPDEVPLQPATRRTVTVTVAIAVVTILVLIYPAIWAGKAFIDWVNRPTIVEMSAQEFADQADQLGLAELVADKLEGNTRLRLTSVLAKDSRGRSYLQLAIGDNRYSSTCYLIEPSPANLKAGDLITVEANFSRLKSDTSLELGEGIIVD